MNKTFTKYYNIKRPKNNIIIAALDKNGGLLLQTAITLKISRVCLYNWIKDDAELQEAILDAREGIIDIAEKHLLNNVKEGKEASVFFLLKTIGKNRGYIEKSQIEQKNIETIGKIEITYIDNTENKE